MTRNEFLNNYWRFYLLLEDRFLKALSYVELCETNYDTYSMEFVSQLREIGSEIDIVMKELCGFAQNDRKRIDNYASVMLGGSYQNIVNQVVFGKGIELKPFEQWNLSAPAASLVWWEAYNNTKHGRVLNFVEANLKNTFNALGALFILNNYLLKKITDGTNDIDIVDEESKLFVMKNWSTKFLNGNNTVMQIVKTIDLPDIGL